MSFILIVTLLPVNVFAAQPQEVDVNVRNRTGGTVEVSLTDESGNIQFFSFEEGVSELTLTEGRYQFWASMPCGNLAGTWNVNISKTLFLSCDEAGPSAELTRRSSGQFGRVCATGEGGFFVPVLGDFFSQDYWEDADSSFKDWAEEVFSYYWEVAPFYTCIADVEVTGVYYTGLPFR